MLSPFFDAAPRRRTPQGASDAPSPDPAAEPDQAAESRGAIRFVPGAEAVRVLVNTAPLVFVVPALRGAPGRFDLGHFTRVVLDLTALLEAYRVRVLTIPRVGVGFLRPEDVEEVFRGAFPAVSGLTLEFVDPGDARLGLAAVAD